MHAILPPSQTDWQDGVSSDNRVTSYRHVQAALGYPSWGWGGGRRGGGVDITQKEEFQFTQKEEFEFTQKEDFQF